MVWNIIIVTLLVYTSIYVPFEIAFYEEDFSLSKMIFNITIDTIFFCDIIINFISAYETNGGRDETRWKKIATAYLTTWFIIDVAATIPTDLI